MGNTIIITDIAFTYLWDEKYFKNYNRENNLTEEEIEERCEELKSQTTLEVDLDDYDFDEEEDDIDDFLVDIIEEETGEYFSTFSWEYQN
jgi:hypothetical protein